MKVVDPVLRVQYVPEEKDIKRVPTSWQGYCHKIKETQNRVILDATISF